MLTVTESAIQAVAEYFRTMQAKPLRIFLTQGCGGRHLAMALDSINTSDAVHEAGGFQFVIEQILLDQARPVKIDYSNRSFKISSSLELGSGCQSCGTDGCCWSS